MIVFFSVSHDFVLKFHLASTHYEEQNMKGLISI
jgi:hypothetical protein